MKLYNAYIRKNKVGKIDDLVVLKEGFLWSAFIFGVFWFVYHKMWQEALILLGTNLLINAMPFFSEADKIMLQIVLSFMIALNASYWYGQYLQKRDYQFLNIISAKTRDEALFIIKDQYQDSYFKDIKGFDADFIDPKISDKLVHKYLKIFKKKAFK